MRSRERHGTRTDLMLHRRTPGTVLSDRGDHHVARTETLPRFRWGNRLILDGPPDDVEAWDEVLERALGDVGLDRRLIGWEVALSDASALPPGTTQLTVSALASSPPACASPSGYVLRPFEDVDHDWSQAVRLLEELVRPTDGPEFVAVQQFRFETFRADVRAGRATWWGAFDGARLAASLGAVRGDVLARLQEVVTDERDRRRGLCSALLSLAAREALEACDELVCVHDDDGDAARLYRSVGFRPVSRQRNLNVERFRAG